MPKESVERVLEGLAGVQQGCADVSRCGPGVLECGPSGLFATHDVITVEVLTVDGVRWCVRDPST